MLLKQLIEIGLSKAQGQIYLKLLQLKQASVLTLARQTNLQRPTIYDNLTKLEALGLISWVQVGGRKMVFVANPQALVRMFAIKQKKAEELLPEFKELYNQGRPLAPKIIFFHGNEGYKRLANIIPTATDKVIRSIGSYAENIRAGFTDKFLKELWQARARHKIKAHVLFTHADRQLLIKDKAYSEIGNIRYNREVRILPPGIELSVLYTIVDDKVLFWSSKKEDFGMYFQSISYANSLITLFDHLWNSSQKL